MDRARLCYSIGNENDPGNPFGRSELAIEADGRARLDQVARGGQRAWTGRVEAAALDRLWAGLEQAGFPGVPQHPVVAGATLCAVAVGVGDARRAAIVEWRAAQRLPGYAQAFAVLDAIVHQFGQDPAARAAASGPALVTDVTVA